MVHGTDTGRKKSWFNFVWWSSVCIEPIILCLFSNDASSFDWFIHSRVHVNFFHYSVSRIHLHCNRIGFDQAKRMHKRKVQWTLVQFVNKIKPFQRTSPFSTFDEKMKLANKRVSNESQKNTIWINQNGLKFSHVQNVKKFFEWVKRTKNNCFDIVIWTTNCCANLIMWILKICFTQSSLDWNLRPICKRECVIQMEIRNTFHLPQFSSTCIRLYRIQMVVENLRLFFVWIQQW